MTHFRAADALQRGHASVDGLLDVALLDCISAGDAAASAQILAEFGRSNDADASGLRHAVHGGDLLQAAYFSHRMRGACAMLGSTLLANACAQVHACAVRHDGPGLHAAMQRVDGEVRRLRHYLKAFHDHAPAVR